MADADYQSDIQDNFKSAGDLARDYRRKNYKQFEEITKRTLDDVVGADSSKVIREIAEMHGWKDPKDTITLVGVKYSFGEEEKCGAGRNPVVVVFYYHNISDINEKERMFTLNDLNVKWGGK